jgi:protein ImuB
MHRQVAYLWVPYFGTAVACRTDGRLAKQPLVLLDEQGRVLAADAGATRAGVVLGMTERQVMARCPQATFHLAARYPIWEAQDTFRERIKRFADRWQLVGLGSAYLSADRVEKSGALLGWCQVLAVEIRRLGWEPALGATGSKFGASVAGQLAGANTALLLVPDAQRAFLGPQPVSFLPLDTDVLTQLRHLGIRTLGQFARLPAAGVLSRFGPAGRTAQRWAQGLDDRPVLPPWEAPEVSARVEFDVPSADGARLLAILTHRAEQLLTPLRERFQVVGRITLLVTRADGRIVPGSYIFPLPTAAAEPVRLGLAAALARVTWDGQPAAEVVLTLGGIGDEPVRQLSLFDPSVLNGMGASAGSTEDSRDLASESRAQLKAVLDRLAARFGPDAFRMAVLTDPDNLLPERRASWRRFDG